jgi:hypothetical protein
MKIRPVGAELFHVDRRTGMTKVAIAFRNFANAPRKRNTQLQCVGRMQNFFFFKVKAVGVYGYQFALIRQNGISVLSSTSFHHL